ncbi:MAG: plasmid mobilization protein, partial [Candidatus Aenigmatarchaeota archaeon]
MKKEKRKREKRETEIKIRLTAKEREEIRELAREEGLTVSEYIRKQALK